MALERSARTNIITEVNKMVPIAIEGINADDKSCSLVGVMVLFGINQNNNHRQTGINKIPVPIWVFFTG